MTKSTITGPKTRTSQAGAKLACIWVNISLRERGSVWFRSKKRPWKGIFGFDRARNLARTKKNEREGRGRGRKETLADKPFDFENLRSPANAAPDWLG